MSAPATYDDVNLVLRLFELRREEKMRAARQWFAATMHATTLAEFEQLCPLGSEPNAYARMVTSYWEMVAGFITAGVLNEELFFQSGRELLFVWLRMKALAPQIREAYKDPTYLRNLEVVAGRYIAYLNRQSPELVGAFAERINKIGR